jgi:hypothetical protein
MAAVTITAANVVPQDDASYGYGEAGEALDSGDWVAFDTDDGLLYKAEQADTTRKDVVGIAVSTADVAGQRVTYAKRGSTVAVGSVLTQGTPYFLGTDGVMEEVSDLGSGDYVVYCAVATSATELVVKAITSEASLA